VSIEGTRSYGAGLSRAVIADGLTVMECEQPTRKARRGRGKSDAIDARLAVMTALRLDADRLPTPEPTATGEALRILLGAGPPAERSPAPFSPPWPGVDNPATPTAMRRFGALDRAIHTIAMTRGRCCAATRTHIARRIAEGEIPKEIRRRLKQLHRPRALPRPHTHRQPPRGFVRENATTVAPRARC
jgi:hypothetical protein